MTKKRKPSTDDEPTSLAAPEKTLTLREMKERAMNVRTAAKLHYITDPEERGVEWWWQNGSVTSSRPDGTRETILFREHIGVNGFIAWSKEEKWATERSKFWDDVELSVLTNLRDETVKEKIEEVRTMRQSRAYLTEYLFPLRDPKAADGIKRYPPEHKWAGLPVFPLDLGNMPKFIESYLKLDERIGVKRGDLVLAANSEIEDITGGVTVAKESPGTQVAKRKMDLTNDDVRAMAKQLLLKREASLQTVVEAEVIEDDDDDEEDDGDESI